MAKIITSQHYLNDEIVAAKLAAEDFDVLISPAFTVDGEEFHVVLDGNHSLAAALAAGVEPKYIVADHRDHDAVLLLERGEVDDFLLVVHMGEGDYVDAITRKSVW